MKTHAIRLHPGQDLKREIKKLCADRHMQAGAILTCVGSLQKAVLRLADENITKVFEERFEIVSLVGTISLDGVHLHASIADARGNVIGGHVSDGCLIYTTAEIVIGEIDGHIFRRSPDEQTGFDELEIESTM